MTLARKKETETDRRRYPRKKCIATVGYATHDYTDMEYIQDINAWGVFIKTGSAVLVGETISMTIPLTDEQKSIKIIGEVVRKNSEGIGVKFKMGIDDAVVNAIAKNK